VSAELVGSMVTSSSIPVSLRVRSTIGQGPRSTIASFSRRAWRCARAKTLRPIVGGWHGVSRGGQRALLEYTITPPGGAAMTYLGHLAKPVLAPVALRATPLPTWARAALAAGGAVLLALIVWAIAAWVS
jgi:hypothetical protein